MLLTAAGPARQHQVRITLLSTDESAEMPSIDAAWRGALFAVVTSGVLTWQHLYRIPSPPPRLWPPVTFLGDTWYGPVLFSLIPLSLLWFSLALKRRGLRILGVIASILVGGFCALQIYWHMSMSGKIFDS